jgi:excisionase family DNA binding protein
MTTTATTGRWVPIQQIAEHIHCHRSTIYDWIRDRGMPHGGFPGSLRFNIAEVDAWLRAGGAR